MLNNNMHQKGVFKSKEMKIQYIKLMTFWAVVSLGFVVSLMIKEHEGIMERFFGFLYLIFAYPICAAVYGSLAYKLTKKVLVPNLFLYFVSVITYIIACYITASADLGEFIRVLKVSLTVCAPFLIISLIFSGAPHLVKSKKRNK